MVTSDAYHLTKCFRGFASPIKLILIFALLVGILSPLQKSVPAWVWMWSLAVTMFVASKTLILFCATPSSQPVGVLRRFAFFALDPNLDPKPHTEPRHEAPVLHAECLKGINNIIIGAGLLWIVVPHVSYVYLKAGTGMIAIALMLHFGMFQLVGLAWRLKGIPVDLLMNKPLAATSIAEFWGLRWNRGFNYLVKTFVFKPMAKARHAPLGMFTTFLVSGLIHEAVITVPCWAGFGLPTCYFLIQWLGILAEKRIFSAGNHRRLRWHCRLFTLGTVIIPVPLLFPPVFLREVIYPMLQFLTFNQYSL